MPYTPMGRFIPSPSDISPLTSDDDEPQTRPASEQPQELPLRNRARGLRHPPIPQELKYPRSDINGDLVFGAQGKAEEEDYLEDAGLIHLYQPTPGQISLPGNIVSSNSPKSKRIRRLEEMVECKDIEIKSLKCHHKRMEEWNKVELQRVRDLEAEVERQKQARQQAEEGLIAARREMNAVLETRESGQQNADQHERANGQYAEQLQNTF